MTNSTESIQLGDGTGGLLDAVVHRPGPVRGASVVTTSVGRR